MPDQKQVRFAPHYFILILPIFLLISIPVRLMARKVNCVFPHVLLLLVLAMALGVLVTSVRFLKPYEEAVTLSPHLMFTVFVPIFIMSSVYRMDYYIFVRCLPQVLLVSLFGVIFNAFILMFILKIVLHTEWNKYQAFIGALLTLPIQPMHVICLFKELAKYKYLGTMLEAEALIRIVPVEILFVLVLGMNDGYVTKWYQYVSVVMRLVGGGLVVGYIMGKVMARCMSWLYNEPLSALCMSISMTYLTYYSSEFFFAFSGSLSVFCLVCFVALEKHRLTSEVDNCINSFWGTLHYVAEIGVLMTATMESTIFVTNQFEMKDLFGTIIIYFSGVVLRFAAFLIMGPILSRMTYNLSLKCLLVLGWSDVKGVYNLLFASSLPGIRSTRIAAKTFLMEMLIYTLLSLAINSSSIKLTLRLMGLSDLSSSRRTNMNNCMKFIMDKRHCIINILKMNRYLANANWAFVRNETNMKHPYKSVRSEIDAEEDGDIDELQWNTGDALCPDCLKDVPFDISEKELGELLKDAQIKILKAKKVSIHKQYDNGIINKNCLQVLVHNLGIMMESNKERRAFNIKKYLRKSASLSSFEKIFKKLCSTHNYRPPKTQCRRLCYYTVFHLAYDYLLFLIIVLNAAFCIWNSGSFIPDLMFVYHAAILQIFLIDFILKIIGLSRIRLCIDGFKYYFRSYWNIFDFTLLLLSFANLILVEGSSPKLFGWINYYGLPTFRTISIIRLLKFFHLLGILCPNIIRAIENKINKRICFGFDLATALVNCDDEILDTFSQILDMKMLRDIYHKEITDERQGLIKAMEVVQRERPWIAITVKTKQAIRTTLTTMEESLNDLKDSGFVDSIEYAYIFREIYGKQKQLRNMKFVQPTPPKVIFKEVAWMCNDTDLIEFLYNYVQTEKWDAGEVVCREGMFSKGIYIVVTGLLRLKYVPKDSVILRSKTIGSTPVVDYLANLNFDRKFEDHIMSGSSIGELSILTERAYDCTIVAESPSQAYLLTTDVVKDAIRLNMNPVTGLEARMWKHSVINLAVAIMMEVPLYQSYTQEQIKFKLERSFMPNLRCYKLFVVSAMMDDVILIEGVVSDYNTGEMFIAPTMIPRSVQKLILPRSSYLMIDDNIDARLLIIPKGDAKEFEIMENEEDIAELVSMPSSKCLLHTIQYTRKRVKSAVQKKKLVKASVLTKDSLGTTQYVWRENKQIHVIEPAPLPADEEEDSEEGIVKSPSILLLKNRMLYSKEEVDDDIINEPVLHRYA